MEIFREGADACLCLCWVCISSFSQTCDGKSRGGWNGRRSPGVNQKECSKVTVAALFLTLVVFSAIKRSWSVLILCSPHFFLSSSTIILVFKLWLWRLSCWSSWGVSLPSFAFAPASHSSVCATLLTIQVFTFSQEKKNYLVCYFSSVWKVLSFPGIPSCVKMCWFQRLRCPARGPVSLSVKMRKHLWNPNCGMLLWRSVFIFKFL